MVRRTSVRWPRTHAGMVQRVDIARLLTARHQTLFGQLEEQEWPSPTSQTCLKASMGLDAASIGGSAIERAVLERVSACGVAGPAMRIGSACVPPPLNCRR